MLEEPNIKKSEILEAVAHNYHLEGSDLTFLPLGADLDTAVYQLVTKNREEFFLKLRKGEFNEIVVRVPFYLDQNKVGGMIPPLPTCGYQLWYRMGEFSLILYPFIRGVDGYTRPLSTSQWLKFGEIMRQVHACQLPIALSRMIPRETFSAFWRQKVRVLQEKVLLEKFEDPQAASLAEFMQANQARISQSVKRADSLADRLKQETQQFVLCHADIHPGNLHLPDDQAVYLVDWDAPILAPRERDLGLIGGCSTWSNPRDEASFYQGYGETRINWTAMAYYRYERVIADFAVIGEMLLLSSAGGPDREQHLGYFTGNFLPGHELDLADKAFARLTETSYIS